MNDFQSNSYKNARLLASQCLDLKHSMIKKTVANVQEALDGVKDGMTFMLGGFGLCGIPENAINQSILELNNLLVLVANFVRENTEVEFQSENGILGMGPFPKENKFDISKWNLNF